MTLSCGRHARKAALDGAGRLKVKVSRTLQSIFEQNVIARSFAKRQPVDHNHRVRGTYKLVAHANDDRPALGN